MTKNPGFKNEDNMVFSLNNRRFGELNQNLKFMLLNIYDFIEDDEIINCELVPGRMKPDIVISCHGIKKYISIKHGRAKTIHQQEIETFIKALRLYGADQKVIKWILYLFYCDGTLNGTGKVRYKQYEFQSKYLDTIGKINDYFERDKELIQKVVYHCLFQGIKEEYIHADYIYFGDPDYGVLCSPKQIRKYIEVSNWKYMKSVIHIGPLQFRRHAQYAGTEIKNAEYMSKVDVWWANLEADMRYISRRYSD